MYRIKVQGDKALIASLKAKPAQIARASRQAINKVNTDIHKELSSSIPKTHGTNITGYRKIRTHKTPAKARRKRIQGTTWWGGNSIAAIYARNKAKQVTGGVRVGAYFYENAFIATMKSGHVGVFQRVHGSSKIKEATISLTEAPREVREVANKAKSRFHREFKTQLAKQFRGKR